jgi:hypothetical protein
MKSCLLDIVELDLPVLCFNCNVKFCQAIGKFVEANSMKSSSYLSNRKISAHDAPTNETSSSRSEGLALLQQQLAALWKGYEAAIAEETNPEKRECIQDAIAQTRCQIEMLQRLSAREGKCLVERRQKDRRHSERRSNQRRSERHGESRTPDSSQVAFI